MNSWLYRWLLGQTFVLTNSLRLWGRRSLPSVSASQSRVSCLRSYSPFTDGRRITGTYVCPARSFSSEFQKNISADVGTPELEAMLDTGSVQLVDVREPEELTETGKIPSSVNIPLGILEEALKMSPEDFQSAYGVPKPLPSDKDIVFHCKRGIRSKAAMEIAQKHGYTGVRHYYPGMDGWLAER